MREIVQWAIPILFSIGLGWVIHKQENVKLWKSMFIAFAVIGGCIAFGFLIEWTYGG